jgi:hypothetical protein
VRVIGAVGLVFRWFGDLLDALLSLMPPLCQDSWFTSECKKISPLFHVRLKVCRLAG